MLKAKRARTKSTRKSLYGALRREPRREALSTLEAAALALSRLEAKPEIETALLKDFGLMLDKYRSALAEGLIAPENRKSAPPPA